MATCDGVTWWRDCAMVSIWCSWGCGRLTYLRYKKASYSSCLAVVVTIAAACNKGWDGRGYEMERWLMSLVHWRLPIWCWWLVLSSSLTEGFDEGKLMATVQGLITKTKGTLVPACFSVIHILVTRLDREIVNRRWDAVLEDWVVDRVRGYSWNLQRNGVDSVIVFK